MYQQKMLLKEKIGDGYSSNLHLCDYQGKQSVIKIYKEDYPIKLRNKEIKILKSLDHPHILKMIDHHPENDYIIFEQLTTDFFTIVKNQNRLDVRAVKQILIELGEAIQYLHKFNYVHRDIKLQNLMLNNHLQMILIDFGFADLVDDQEQNIRSCGTQNYMSPELLISQKYIRSNLLKRSDIFALAVLIFILYFGFPPFSEATVKCPYWRLISKNNWVKFWKIVNRNSKLNDIIFQELFENMISPNLEDRYTIEQVLNHPWIDGNHDLGYLINII
ncbi:unnamed protein product (macronuclear) [Paramecium tetraurelia]|uniref:Protein kinase domain-containing protein n=1 Tax=Paramecium tetraurelia TaxID=5888 RepID=A0BN47_PARTE|nr:uncharacterized protein GSPATT00030602001 [Paramecium tetraurelia]CAK59964.1 unnamed protein product [Paramecium tetraurelia]|eukprot:XP_001427362.1 hypothetical protein (macronuclear) [Paramecium tetraurelia strain d4-2]